MGQKHIIIWTGDQLTTSRLCELKGFCSRDKDPYECLSWIEPIFGWFHLPMAFSTSLHNQYYGTKAGIGPLKEIATAHFPSTRLEITGMNSIRGSEGVSPMCCPGIRYHNGYDCMTAIGQEGSTCMQVIQLNRDLLQ